MYIGDPLTQSLTHCCSEGRALPLWKCMQYDYAQYMCVSRCLYHLQKLLGYLSPTKDEEDQIRDARAENPNLPLGPAEEFLYTLSTIPELKARLSLWKFRFSFKAFEEVSPTMHCTCRTHTPYTPQYNPSHCMYPPTLTPTKMAQTLLHTSYICSLCYCITEKGWFSKYQLSTVCNLADSLVRCTGLTVESWYLANYPSLVPEPPEKPPLQCCMSVTELFPPPPPPLVLQEFADAMMDVKCAMSDLRTCPTFKYFLACLLAVGNFLNHGKEVRHDMWTVHTYVRTYTVCTLVEHGTHRVMRGSIIRLYYIHLLSTLSSALPSRPLPSPPSFSGGGLPPQFPAKADGCEGQHQETTSAASLGCHGDGKVSRQH